MYDCLISSSVPLSGKHQYSNLLEKEVLNNTTDLAMTQIGTPSPRSDILWADFSRFN